MSVPEQWEVRVGDAEREAMVQELRTHFGAGRLSLEEFEERAGKAMAARKRADLVPLVADLPEIRSKGSSGPPVRLKAPPPEDGWDVAFRIHVAIWAVLSVFFVLLGIFTRGIWPVYPILSIGLSVGIHYAIKVAVKGTD